ncbi:hypothetical protein JOQ06_003217 [Pogonophryne albipinna]|uniref:Core-binding factor subunit beta n=1 Tax=Pogonophryne albipinna TaxID=1090488 RepID=A0AAD6B9B9_9TELE|nr:hypothetical protein JOQ06_003217 [Pogonophryne albipinna]
MPRVVPDQRSKFENEEFFRKLSRECEIKYTGFRDRPHEERQARFQNASRDGRSEIAFVATGTNLSLQFFAANLLGDQRQVPAREYVDFERETGKVGQVQDKHTALCCSSPFAMVIWSELQQRDWI